jgi:multidrug efflux pump subunit AcrA (membrane-fusion protein)
MSHLRGILICVSLVAGVVSASAQESREGRQTPLGVARIEHAVVSLKDFVAVPAMANGPIERLSLEDGTVVSEGVEVKKNELLGHLDLRDADVRLKASESQLQVAEVEYQKAIHALDAAKKTVLVAESEHQESIDVNRRLPGTIPETQVRRQKLTFERSQIETQVAEQDKEAAQRTTLLRRNELEIARINLEHQQLKSPIDGEVVQVFRKLGEWVQEGTTVVRIVHMQTLRVEGFLKIRDVLPQDVVNQPVKVEVRRAGQVVEFESKISYVSPLVQANGEYRVVCEVENRKEGGQWVLLPGMDARMAIQMKNQALAQNR